MEVRARVCVCVGEGCCVQAGVGCAAVFGAHGQPPAGLTRAGDAAAAWRADKLRNFRWRLRCVGLEDDPALAGLLAQMEEQSHTLDEMWEAQRAPDYQRPWWQDGEYDAARADRCVSEIAGASGGACMPGKHGTLMVGAS